MKTFITTIIAAMFTLTLSAATPAAPQVTTTLSNVKNISKIVVAGNVDLILIQGATESVKVYDSYYAKNALVQQEEGTLRISSYAKEKLTVAVYVRSLSAIEAHNNTTITTHNKFSLLALDVTLKDNAKADINADMVKLTTSVNDSANLKLSGSSAEYTGLIGATARLNLDQFKSDSSSIRSVSPVYAATNALAKESDDYFELPLGK